MDWHQDCLFFQNIDRFLNMRLIIYVNNFLFISALPAVYVPPAAVALPAGVQQQPG